MQPYASLTSFVSSKDLILTKPREDWRLVAKPLIGEVNGIPNIRGMTIATNGILVIVENEVGKLWTAHLAWFVVDEATEETDLFDEARVKRTKHQRMFEEFV